MEDNKQVFVGIDVVNLRNADSPEDCEGHNQGKQEALRALRSKGRIEAFSHDAGHSRSDAAKVAGVTLQIVRDWVLRFNEAGPEGLVTRKAPGKASILNDIQCARLAEIVEAGQIPAAHGVVCWRLVDLGQSIWDEELRLQAFNDSGSAKRVHVVP